MRWSLKKLVFIALVAVCCYVSGLPLSAIAADTAETKQIVVEANEIKNTSPGFEIKLWTQGDKNVFHIKDTVAFKFKANKDCYVTLLDIGTDGTVYKIFPNKWHKSSRVTKDTVYSIPPEDGKFTFRVKGPVGVEYVKAIATAEPLKTVTDSQEGEEEEFSEIKEPEAAIKNLKVELNKREKQDWAESVVSFKVKKVESEE